MFISVMSLNTGYSNIQGFTTADLAEYTQLPAEINKPVTWIKNDTQQIVETEPPEVVETDTSEVGGKLQKRVTVSSDIHYENILTYASIPDLLPEQVRLFWMIDGVKTDVTELEEFNITFYDEDGDTLIDKISWITPHLSEQEFILEFDITVINPWTAGSSGEDWRVYFTTTGTGTLNITQDELSNQVLTFNYIKCGDTTIYSSMSEYSYIIENYSCSEIAEISHTIGEMPLGVFGMQFDFGNDLNHDVDFAYDPAPDPDTDGDGLTDFEESVFTIWCNSVMSHPYDINLPIIGGNGCAALAAGQCANKRGTPISDADGDCLSSEYETYGSSTSDANPDTDGGGECDYDEVINGRDPNDVEDDVPGPCSSGGGGGNTDPVWSEEAACPNINEDAGTTDCDTNLIASGNGHCTDADGDTLSFSIIAENVAQVDCDTSGNAFTATPAANFFGTGECIIRCDDGNGGTVDSDVHTIIIDPVNDPPVLTGIPNSAVNEDSGLSNNHVDLYTYHSDVDGSDAASNFSITSQSASGVVNCIVDSDRYLDCTTQANQSGASSINITATDAGSATDTDLFVLTVNAVNDAPTSGTPTISPGSATDTNNLTASNTSFSDADGDTLTAIYDWRLEGTSIAILNTQFDTDTTSPKDYSSYGNDLTATGATWRNAATCGLSGSGGCYEFDGSDDRLTRADDSDFDSLTALSVCAWVYPDSWGGATGADYIADKRHSSSNWASWAFFFGNTGTKLRLKVIDSSNSDDTLTYTPGGTFTTGVWHHVCGTWDGSQSTTTYLYVNGSEVASKTDSVGTTLLDANGILAIGALGDLTQHWFDGKIDGLQIYDRALSADQITGMYNSGTPAYTIIDSDLVEDNANWTVAVTPNDVTVDGTTKTSAIKNIGSSNTAPTDITPNSISVNENSAGGTTVGTLSATDSEGGSMTWSELTGGDGEHLFQIASSTGVVTVTSSDTLNYESSTSWIYEVRVEDSGGLTYDENITININNVNEAPVWASVIADEAVDADSSSASVDLNLTNSTGGGQCTDVDAGASLTFTVQTENIAQVNCAISTNALTQQPAANYSGTASCTIRCSDGNLSADDTFDIVVAKTLSMSLSTNLANDLDWAVANTTGIVWNASENNGAGATGYYVTIEAHGGEPDVKIKSSANLTKGSGTDIGIGNYTYKNSTTNTVLGSATAMTTSYVNSATNLDAGSSHNVYFKFFLNVSSAVSAGTYTTTTYFQGVV